MKTNSFRLMMALVAGTWSAALARSAEPLPSGGVFAKSNLAAWCVVPFDAAKRGPRQRAEMLQELGIRNLAYDWRAEHVPAFEEEIVQLKKHSIGFFAFWGFHPAIVPLLAKHDVTPEFWIMLPNPPGTTDDERLDSAVKQLGPLVQKTRELGCKLGLYNHGGWGGEPANMVRIVKRLRQEGHNDHVGIVYNFHHAFNHIHDFPQVLAEVQPYLLCINLNGMNGTHSVLPLGSGQYEQSMMETIKRSGYAGPIGIIAERPSLDAKESLKQNLDGMKKILKRIGDETALKTYD